VWRGVARGWSEESVRLDVRRHLASQRRSAFVRSFVLSPPPPPPLRPIFFSCLLSSNAGGEVRLGFLVVNLARPV
jgi:hypothetical protein